MKFDVIQGDIAQQSADVLVNAAGTSLQMGSGVAGALRAEGGQELNEEAVSQGLIDLGAVAVTDAYDLDARWVIHAAAMPHHGDREATADELGAQRSSSRRLAVASQDSISNRAHGYSARLSRATTHRHSTVSVLSSTATTSTKQSSR